jgi:hypothetical protein
VHTNGLRKYRHPAISDYVVHISGRSGTAGPGVPDGIRSMKDWERLGQILVDQRIMAFPPFGSSEPVVCLTECTTAGIKTLMADRRYTPCGVAFAKDFIFRRGGYEAALILFGLDVVDRAAVGIEDAAIDLDEGTVALLQRWRQARIEEQNGVAPEGDELVFTKPDGRWCTRTSSARPSTAPSRRSTYRPCRSTTFATPTPRCS